MKKLIALMLFICMAVTLFACGESAEGTESSSVSVEESKTVSESATESESESSTEEQAATFKVKVVNANGDPIANVMLQLCKDTCIPAKTGEDGVASFKAEITDGYKLSVLTCPEGYIYEGEPEIYLESGITEYTVELSEGSEK